MKDLFKETGKYLYDISKIVLGLAVVTPLIKDEPVSIGAILTALVIFSTGAVMIYKGNKNDS